MEKEESDSSGDAAASPEIDTSDTTCAKVEVKLDEDKEDIEKTAEHKKSIPLETEITKIKDDFPDKKIEIPVESSTKDTSKKKRKLEPKEVNSDDSEEDIAVNVDVDKDKNKPESKSQTKDTLKKKRKFTSKEINSEDSEEDTEDEKDDDKDENKPEIKEPIIDSSKKKRKLEPKEINSDDSEEDTEGEEHDDKDENKPEIKEQIIDSSKKKIKLTPKEINSDDPEEDNEDEDDDKDKDKPETKITAEVSEYDPANVHYEGDIAIYTDAKSGYQYKWSKETNEWLPREKQIYGFEDDTHTYTDADGAKYFWDVEKNAWFPKIDDDFMAKYQMSYGFIDNTTKPEPKKEEKKEDEIKKEVVKKVEKSKEAKEAKKKAPPPEPTWFEVNDQENTKVYVSNLPTDITEEEFVDFMQKCGLVMRDVTTGKMKVKLYTVPGTDILKGDALCTYIKIESVDLALSVLDGYLFKEKRIIVERAKFQMKGSYNPSLKPKKKKKKEKDKIKKMQEKLFDWRPDKLRGERSKHERVVIVKNLFEPTLFDREVGLILEYQQDLREECAKCGDVRRVVLYDRHPEGVAQITMKEPEQADECVTLLNGRWFGQRKLTAEIWDGKTKFKIAETDAQISKRLTEWDKFLEAVPGEKPVTTDKTDASVTSDTTKKPVTSGTTEKPVTSEITEKSVTSDITEQPSETIEKPATSETIEKSDVSDTIENPITSDITEKSSELVKDDKITDS